MISKLIERFRKWRWKRWALKMTRMNKRFEREYLAVDHGTGDRTVIAEYRQTESQSPQLTRITENERMIYSTQNRSGRF